MVAGSQLVGSALRGASLLGVLRESPVVGYDQ